MAISSNKTRVGAFVSASKAGYFIDTTYILMSADRQLDFDLEPAVYISLGEMAAPVGEARCASFGCGGGAHAVDASILSPDGTIGINGSSSSPLNVTLPVAAGLTFRIDVVHVSASTRDFSLTTTLP
jgi:hypothetical protein